MASETRWEVSVDSVDQKLNPTWLTWTGALRRTGYLIGGDEAFALRVLAYGFQYHGLFAIWESSTFRVDRPFISGEWSDAPPRDPEYWLAAEFHPKDKDLILAVGPDGNFSYRKPLFLRDMIDGFVSEFIAKLSPASDSAIYAAITTVYDLAECRGDKPPNIREVPAQVRLLLRQSLQYATEQKIQNLAKAPQYLGRRLPRGVRGTGKFRDFKGVEILKSGPRL